MGQTQQGAAPAATNILLPPLLFSITAIQQTATSQLISSTHHHCISSADLPSALPLIPPDPPVAACRLTYADFAFHSPPRPPPPPNRPSNNPVPRPCSTCPPPEPCHSNPSFPSQGVCKLIRKPRAGLSIVNTTWIRSPIPGVDLPEEVIPDARPRNVSRFDACEVACLEYT